MAVRIKDKPSERVVLPWCRENGLATLTHGALCRGLLSGAINQNTKFKGDDLRKTDPKFQPPRFEQYLKAVNLLERYARDRYGKSVLALAVRWVLDQPGVSVALWGVSHPSELDPLHDVLGWHLDDEAGAHIDGVLALSIKDPVGPEFMAPRNMLRIRQLSPSEAGSRRPFAKWVFGRGEPLVAFAGWPRHDRKEGSQPKE